VVKIIGCIFLLVVGSTTVTAAERYSATEQEVIALQASAEKGNRLAIRKLFELYKRSDGAVSEDIDVALGHTIRRFPRLFLEELQRSGRADCDRCLPSLVGNTGEELVDRFHAQVKELTRRQKALTRVSEKSTENLRNKLVQILEQQIQEIKRIPDYRKE